MPSASLLYRSTLQSQLPYEQDRSRQQKSGISLLQPTAGLLFSFSFFFKKRFIAQKISEIHRVTKLRNCSFNQFALVVPRRARDRECIVLSSYENSSEKQGQRKNTAEEKHSIWYPLVTCVLNSHPKRVTIPDAVLIQLSS